MRLLKCFAVIQIQIYVLRMIHSSKKRKKRILKIRSRCLEEEKEGEKSAATGSAARFTRQLRGRISFLCFVSYGRVPSRTRKRITFENRTFSLQMTLGNDTPLVVTARNTRSYLL